MDSYIDIYCERMEPGLWAEPINAATNFAFILAAGLAYKSVRGDAGGRFLAGVIAAIGVGSFLFHTFATTWAMLADVVPILIYQISYLLLYARRVMGRSWPVTGGMLAGFLILVFAFGTLPQSWMNGSLGYMPALIVLTALGAWHIRHAEKERVTLLAAAAVFILSLTLRTMDDALCTAIPMGTHFLWHCFNAVVLYWTTLAYGRNVTRSLP